MTVRTRNHASEAEDRQAQVASVARQCSSAERQHAALLELRIRGLIEDAEFTTKREALAREIVECTQRVQQLDHPRDEVRSATLHEQSFGARLAADFRSSVQANKRQLIHCVTSGGTFIGYQLHLTPRRPFAFLPLPLCASTPKTSPRSATSSLSSAALS